MEVFAYSRHKTFGLMTARTIKALALLQFCKTWGKDFRNCLKKLKWHEEIISVSKSQKLCKLYLKSFFLKSAKKFQ